MQTEKIKLTTSIQATASAERYRFFGFTGAPTAEGERAMGVAVNACLPGDWVAVAVQGEMLVESGGAVNAGDLVQSDDQARAIVLVAGLECGVARDSAESAGDLIRVIR